MNKAILLLLAITIAGAAQAQQHMKKFGIKGGVNLSTLWGDAEITGSRTAVHMGAMGEFRLSENYSFQPELLYSMQGAKTVVAGIEYEEKLDYIIVPLIVKYHLDHQFSIEAGPQVGMLMSAKRRTDDVKDAYKSIDAGVTAGLCYDLPQGFFFEARYYVGLTGMAKDFDYEGINYPAATITNSVLALSMGFKL